MGLSHSQTVRINHTLVTNCFSDRHNSCLMECPCATSLMDYSRSIRPISHFLTTFQLSTCLLLMQPQTIRQQSLEHCCVCMGAFPLISCRVSKPWTIMLYTNCCQMHERFQLKPCHRNGKDLISSKILNRFNDLFTYRIRPS